MTFQICSRYITENKYYLFFSNVRINLLQHWLPLGRIVTASPGEVPSVVTLNVDANVTERMQRLEAAKLTFGQTEL